MEKTHNKKTKQEIMEMYPTGTYYICANGLYDDPSYDLVKQVTNADDILGIVNDILIHAEEGKGCLFYKGVWAPICDEHGNLLELTPSEPHYQIY